MEFLAIGVYIVLAAAVVYFSLKLSDYVDLLDKKTNLSGALLGGILLAAVTSLPEFFTSLTATTILATPNNQLVLGNILGSNAFNLVLFFIAYAIFFKNMVDAKVGKGHFITMGLAGGLYIVTTIASFVFDGFDLLWGWFNPMSLVIAAIYVFSIIMTPKVEEGDDEEESKSKLTVKQIVILFVIFAVLLIGASIGLTYVTDWVNSLLHIDATIGGALFLGIATSLPELTATFNLSKKKNYDAVYGNVLGSGVFNFFILFLADVLSFRCPEGLYKISQSSFLLIISGVFSTIVVVSATLIKLSGKMRNKMSYRILFTLFGLLIVASYVSAVVLSFNDLSIPFAPFGN